MTRDTNDPRQSCLVHYFFPDVNPETPAQLKTLAEQRQGLIQLLQVGALNAEYAGKIQAAGLTGYISHRIW